MWEHFVAVSPLFVVIPSLADVAVATIQLASTLPSDSIGELHHCVATSWEFPFDIHTLLDVLMYHHTSIALSKLENARL